METKMKGVAILIDNAKSFVMNVYYGYVMVGGTAVVTYYQILDQRGHGFTSDDLAFEAREFIRGEFNYPVDFECKAQIL